MNTLKSKKLKRTFGTEDEYGFSDVPTKMSNVKYSRVLYGEFMGCSFCFPHGYETINSTVGKNFRSWKFEKEKQWSKKTKKSYKKTKTKKGKRRWINDRSTESVQLEWRFKRELYFKGEVLYKWPYTQDINFTLYYQ